MKGTIVLSVGRSGSTWLGGLATATGLLGQSAEWIEPEVNRIDFARLDGKAASERVVELSSSPNGTFLFKVFPFQLQRFHASCGVDPLAHIARNHDVQFLRLERKDRLGQAISFARAVQSGTWESGMNGKTEPVYDFELICRYLFLIERCLAFWKVYATLLGKTADCLFYEDQLPDGADFLQRLADHAGVVLEHRPEARNQIQRDATNENWRNRFLEEAGGRDIFSYAVPSRVPYRRLSNLIRLLRGKPLKPYPEAYFWHP